MNNQTSRSLTFLILLLLAIAPLFADTDPGEIYRVVDKDGNVTYTDQPPGDGSEPMNLPELSVIQTDPAKKQGEVAPALEREESREVNAVELRKKYSDFKILQPQNEETFWGTANTVVVSWGSEVPLQEGMTVKLYVDGTPREVAGSGGISLQLNRGTHQVHAELYAGGDKPLITTPTVTFFVKQASVGPNNITVVPDGD